MAFRVWWTKTDPALLAGGSNRSRIPEGAILVPGATYELYTADDIYSLDGALLAAADTLLATATTGEDGLAHFPVDVPIRGENYGNSDAHDWTTNSGRYYIREIAVPDGYLIERSDNGRNRSRRLSARREHLLQADAGRRRADNVPAR